MVDVILGLQWGDEGKGKIADFLTPQYDIVTRFQGGPNAGHSLHFDGKKFVLNTIPSGIFHPKVINVIGNGVVLDPVRIKVELQNIINAGSNPLSNLLISKKCHLILPTHRILDAASEAAKGKEKIGSTLRGIGPTYMDKTGRNGLRAGDIFSPNFKNKYQALVEKHLLMIKNYGYTDFDLDTLEIDFFDAIEYLKTYQFIDSEYYLNEAIENGKKILAEGAQGSLLDIDFGSYPYVTSSNTTTGGVCTGLGIPPKHIGKVIGIFKAYCTRVGSGPFPTELDNALGEKIRQNGMEFGATTGRPRRTGWLDLPALKYAIMVNGVDELVMMKADVLSGIDTIEVCTGYNGQQHLPFDIAEQHIEGNYQSMQGWMENVSKIRVYDDLPHSLKQYCNWIEDVTGKKLNIISIGPDRDETITLS